MSKTVVESPKLKEVRGKITKRRDELAELFAAGGNEMNLSAEQVDQIRALNDELTDLSQQAEGLQELHDIQAGLTDLNQIDRGALHPPQGGQGRQENQNAGKSLGQRFIESRAYVERGSGSSIGPEEVLSMGMPDIRATLFETSAGYAPESTRIPGLVVPKAMRPIQILDIIPTVPTSQAAIVYMEETTATNNAAERSEGGAYAESALAYTERSKTVRSIGTSLPVTDEQLADVPGIMALIDGRLMFFERQRLDGQVLNGDDNAPNLGGILNVSGLQTQAKGADPVPDAIYKAMTKVRVTGRAFPNATIMHPNDWQDIRLLRTADGVYIWGSPAEVGPEMIWGLRVVQSDAIAENTGLVGDFSAAMLALHIREEVSVQVGYVGDNFKEGKRTIRAGMRCALAIYRGSAYCTVTSI